LSRRVLAALALAVAGCRHAEKAVVHELVPAVPSAEAEVPWEHLSFGTLAAEPFQEKGFERAHPEPFSDSHAIARTRAQVLLRWSAPAPRMAILDAAPLPDAVGSPVEVRLNDTSVARLSLQEGRRRYAFALPVEAQRPHSNRLALEFIPPAGTPGAAAGTRRSARLYSLTVGGADDADLQWLGRDGAPPVVGIGQGPRSRAVVQAGPSAVRFAFRSPAGAELRFTPDLHPRARAEGAAAVLSVALAAGPGGEREIWRRRLAAGDAPPDEVALDLNAAPAEAVRVVFRVTPEGGRRPAWALWQGLRVMGDAASGGAGETAGARPGDGPSHDVAPAGVLLVILDAAAAGHFGCYGYGRRTTPEIDRIAAEGVVYERAYSPAVFTRSAMASIWTSQYPDQHRVGVDPDVGIAVNRPTLAELLSAGGIETAGFIGNPVARGFGLDRGFSEFRSVYEQKTNLGRVTHAEAFRSVLPAFFAARRAPRLFAYVHYLEPHFPYDPPEPFNTLFGPDAPLTIADRRQLDWSSAVNDGRIEPTPDEVDHLRRLYDGSLAYVDQEVGFLRRTLEQAGRWDRMLVIVAADHGEGLHEHGWIGHMKKVNEEAARVPLVMRYPAGRGPAGTRVGEVVSLLDLAPTVADALGVAVPGGTFQGRSLIRGAPGSRVVTRNSDTETDYAVTEDRYRLIFHTSDRAQQLFDTAADPGETRDLAESRPAWAAAHRQALQRFLLALQPETPAPIRPLSPSELEALRALGYVR